MNKTSIQKFGAKSTALEVIAEHRLDSKVAVVTGAYSGIGIETARALAHAGAHVVLAVRDQSKGKFIAAELKESTGNQKISALALDLFDLDSVRRFAQVFLADFQKLDLLINNAGVMASPQAYSREGYESQFATNHLGHFLLANLLMDGLVASAPSRVVSLSSIAHRRSDINFEDIHYKHREYDKWQAYGQSKTANALFAVGLTQHYQNSGVTANAVMPGGIQTTLQKHVPSEEQRQLGWIDEDNQITAKFKTPEQGAATSIWAAVAPELNGAGGLYLEDCQIAKEWCAEHPLSGVLPYALDCESAEKLWEISKFMVRISS